MISLLGLSFCVRYLLEGSRVEGRGLFVICVGVFVLLGYVRLGNRAYTVDSWIQFFNEYGV